MLDSFIFSLNSTVPVFLVILFGMLLRKLGVFTEDFASMTDRFVFRVALPILLFKDISGMDFRRDFDFGFVALCASVSLVMFLLAWGIGAIFIKEKRSVGSFAQGSARGSAAILGVALVENIYGSSGLAPMMIFAVVPLFNIMSVIMLSFSDEESEKPSAAVMLKRIVTNPIIIGALAGVPFSVLGITFPAVISGAIRSVASTATPMALLAIGASFSFAAAKTKLKPAVFAAAIKLLLLPALFLPVAAFFGFRDSALVSFFVMLGAPTTVTAYIMSKNMNGDHVLSSNIIMISTLASSATITFWVFLMRMLGLI